MGWVILVYVSVNHKLKTGRNNDSKNYRFEIPVFDSPITNFTKLIFFGENKQ